MALRNDEKRTQDFCETSTSISIIRTTKSIWFQTIGFANGGAATPACGEPKAPALDFLHLASLDSIQAPIGRAFHFKRTYRPVEEKRLPCAGLS